MNTTPRNHGQLEIIDVQVCFTLLPLCNSLIGKAGTTVVIKCEQYARGSALLTTELHSSALTNLGHVERGLLKTTEGQENGSRSLSWITAIDPRTLV